MFQLLIILRLLRAAAVYVGVLAWLIATPIAVFIAPFWFLWRIAQ